MQKLRIKKQSNCMRSGTVNLGHPIIKRPPIRSICKAQTRNWGNSKLLGRIADILFNVPSHIFTIFQNSQESVERCPWQATTQFIKFEPVPIYMELSFYSICKISSVFDDNTWSKIIFQIQNFLHLLKSMNHKHISFELVSIQSVHRHPPRVRLHSERETWLSTMERTSASKQNTVITQIYKNKNKKSSLSRKPEKAT